MLRELSSVADVLAAGRRAEEAGRWDQALSLYQGALEEWQPRGGAPVCELLRKIGLVHYYRGDFDVALNLFESSARLAGEADLEALIAPATNCCAIVRQALGQLDLASDLYRQAHQIAQRTGQVRLAVMIDQNLGTIASIRGDTAEALNCYQSALARYTDLGDQLGATRVLNNIGMAYADLRQFPAAEAAFDHALKQAAPLNDVETLATIQLNRGELYIRLERFDDARACLDQAFEIFARLESKSGLGETYKAYGVLYRESGKLHLAEAHLSLVAELAQAADHPLLEAEAENEYALVHLAQGRNRDALRSLNRAHRLFADLKARRELVDIERHMDRLEHNYLQVVQVWGESIESKDHYTAGHCARVAHYTVKLAEAIGFVGRDLIWLKMGAFLHDVGKTTLDAAVLNKPSGLDPREWEEVRRHTIAGDEIVAELGFPFDIRPMVRSHHERWDGRGYPDQLAGEQIPLIARVLCIADAYDALTSTRSYRAAFAPLKALELMQAEVGGIFDPQLFATFRRLVTTNQMEPPPVTPAIREVHRS
ncbi:MAG TPA: tetratricopeptide repeat protein [Longimicrobiales bacterium]|nr:tetratricopeptide repeat protein [Longimicrobiales bacterium]